MVSSVLKLLVILLILSPSDDASGKSVLMKYDQTVGQNAFISAREKFFEKFRQQEFKSYLEEVEKFGHSKRWTLEDLRRARLRGQRLRIVFEFFDVRHQTPPVFDRFMVVFGYLKDGVSAGTNVQKYATELLKILNDFSVVGMTAQFSPASPNSVELFIEHKLWKALKWSNESRLSLKKYHQLRKSLRSIYFVLRFLGLDRKNGGIVEGIRLIERRMGRNHDLIEELKAQGKTTPSELAVPLEAKEAIKNASKVLLGRKPEKVDKCYLTLLKH